jgi:hypothetical protein
VHIFKSSARVQMLTAALFCAACASAAARIEFPSVIGRGRSMLEMTWEELPFPQGEVQHQVATADKVSVDGKHYDTKYAHSHCTDLDVGQIGLCS